MRAESAIQQAATYAGIKALGSPLDGETLEHGLTALNSMLDSWQAESLYIPHTTEIIQSVAGSPVTIGLGQTINVVRPKFIRDTSFIRIGGFDTPIRWISQQEYNTIAYKGQTGTAYYGYYDEQFPVGKIYIYPVPNGELHLQVDAALPQFADYTTDYAIDTGYKLAIELNLALMMCIGLKEPTQLLLSQAFAAKNRIQQNNATYSILTIDPNVTAKTRVFNGSF